jgi:hypothetical protein
VDPTTADTAAVSFQEPTEFLNFMSGRGYDLVSQERAKYHIDYTFKKSK